MEEPVTALPDTARALETWDQATEQLLSIVEGIDPARWPEPGPYPGWTNKDVLIHLATGYAVRIAVLSGIVERGYPNEPPNADDANAARKAEHKDTSVADLIATLRATRARVRDLIAGVRPEHVTVVVGPPQERRPLAEVLPTLSVHDLEHAADLQRATKT
jgi:uncharacterized protein (TIGR03083 family)